MPHRKFLKVDLQTSGAVITLLLVFPIIPLLFNRDSSSFDECDDSYDVTGLIVLSDPAKIHP